MFELAGGVITPPLSTSSLTFQNSLLKIFPNPNHGMLHLISTQTIEHLEITLYDVLGNKIMTTTFDGFTQNTIDISNQPSGMYFMEANSDGSISHFKIVKE